MKLFKINQEIEIVCERKNTRSGFKHEATLMLGGVECEKVKVCYQNRTWESYEFQSVLHKLVSYKESSLSQEQKELCTAFVKEGKQDNSQMKTVGTVASLGNLFCDTIKEKNDWKLRMIKAGFPQISLPENWESLDENDKADRLDKIVGFLKSSGQMS